MADAPDPSAVDKEKLMTERPRLLNWVWRPRYAKLWWSLTAIYWSVGALGLVFRPILDLYMTDVAYILHVVFYPIFAFVLMAFGWIRAWINALLAEAHPESINKLGWAWNHERESFHERSRREFWDPTDPFSPLFVGRSNNH
jgi:hypothetical protein